MVEVISMLLAQQNIRPTCIAFHFLVKKNIIYYNNIFIQKLSFLNDCLIEVVILIKIYIALKEFNLCNKFIIKFT